jgi:hypothetical protein
MGQWAGSSRRRGRVRDLSGGRAGPAGAAGRRHAFGIRRGRRSVEPLQLGLGTVSAERVEQVAQRRPRRAESSASRRIEGERCGAPLASGASPRTGTVAT